nr:MAG TPA: RNA polymerase sigma factor [Caudoviricetes sp.]
MWVDKKTLKQYRALLREQELNNKAIDRLYDRLDNVPVVAGKVVGSSCNFPYTEVRTTVQMDEPVESDEIKRRLKIREARQEKIREAVLEIEEFIAGLPDSEIRQVFEMCFLDGKKQWEVADAIGVERSTVSKRVDGILKLSHNSQK